MNTPEQEAWLNARELFVSNREILERSLDDHSQIMRIRWGAFERVFNLDATFCSRVYCYGWGHGKSKPDPREVVAFILGQNLKEEDFL